MKKIFFTLTVILIFVTVNTNAQDKPDYTNDPGYVNFGNMSGLSGFITSDNVTEVNIEGYLLKMVSRATENSDPELSQLLGGLKLVKVYSFEATNKDKKEINTKINQLDKTLEGKDWNRLVKVKSPHENVNVYVKTTADQNNIIGLVVTSLDKNGEAAFVNIVGKIDLDAIGRLGHKFNIPMLDSVKANGGK